MPFEVFLLPVNRRLDEWVKLVQLDLDTVEADVDEKVEDKVLFIVYFADKVFFLDLIYWVGGGLCIK